MIEQDTYLNERLLRDGDQEPFLEPFLPSPTPSSDTESTDFPTPLPTETTTRGEKQPTQWRDWPFALIFYIQFITVIVLGSVYANTFIKSQQNEDAGNNDENLDIMTVTLPILVPAGTAVPIILLALVVLERMGKSFIQCSIWSSAVLSFIVGIIGLGTGVIYLGVFGLFGALIGCCYAVSVRDRVPFAAANLSAGVSSIRSNGGVKLISFLLGVVMFIWMILWTISLVGVMNFRKVCDDKNDTDNCFPQAQTPYLSILWVIFLFWTQQVFKNVMHTSVAGIVGTWYFDPDGASSFCSKAISESLFRSLTYSFGSICLGSLCVAILQFLNSIVRSLRSQQQNEEEQQIGAPLLLCCLDCILGMLEGLVEYFNKWVSE